MIRALSVMARFAYFEPCMPTGPRFSWCDAGNAPLPMSVVTTGICMSSASSFSSSDAPDDTVPPPTYRTGRSARAMRATACLICLALPR